MRRGKMGRMEHETYCATCDKPIAGPCVPSSVAAPLSYRHPECDAMVRRAEGAGVGFLLVLLRSPIESVATDAAARLRAMLADPRCGMPAWATREEVEAVLDARHLRIIADIADAYLASWNPKV